MSADRRRTTDKEVKQDMGKPADQYRARVEVSRGSFVKFGRGQSVDFISPLPCPYNYGCLEDTLSDDGEPVDALILGPRLTRGEEVYGQLVGVVYFRDAGLIDDKLILSPSGASPSRREKLQLQLFFRVYALVKRLAHALRMRPSPTVFEGIGTAPRQPLSPLEPE
jgi:inorganic pyrophosphatase